MALTQDARVSFSKKQISALFEAAAIDESVVSLAQEQARLYALDQGHKGLFDGVNSLINGYQGELAHYIGIVRTTILEQNLVDSAQLLPANYFYPQNPTSPPPSLTPNVWTKTRPYARNLAVGKTFAEVYPAPSVTTTPSYLASATNLINIFVGAYINIARATGLKCDTNPFDPPVTDSTLQADAAAIVTAVQDVENSLIALHAAVAAIPETDPARTIQINNTLLAITTALSAINLWQSYPNYSASPGFANCAAFTAYNPNLLGASRFRNSELNPLSSALTSITATLTSRDTYVQTLLGNITQNLGDGSVVGSGLYLTRWNYIGLRINILGGSLMAYYSAARGANALAEQKDIVLSTKALYDTILATTRVIAPTSGTQYIQVAEPEKYSPGDAIWIVSDTQPETVGRIDMIIGNALFMGAPIPAKYRDFELARIYKEL